MSADFTVQKTDSSVENHTGVRLAPYEPSEGKRCDREIAEILNRPDVVVGSAPAWLVTLGLLDWETEKRLIHEGKR